MFYVVGILVFYFYLLVFYKIIRKRIVENCGLNCGIELLKGCEILRKILGC